MIGIDSEGKELLFIPTKIYEEHSKNSTTRKQIDNGIKEVEKNGFTGRENKL